MRKDLSYSKTPNKYYGHRITVVDPLGKDSAEFFICSACKVTEKILWALSDATKYPLAGRYEGQISASDCKYCSFNRAYGEISRIQYVRLIERKVEKTITVTEFEEEVL